MCVLFVFLTVALLRQSNPNWDAYFFVTDDQPFEDELRVILREYADIRLKYLHLDPKFRPKVSTAIIDMLFFVWLIHFLPLFLKRSFYSMIL